jgi:hypothetical protein
MPPEPLLLALLPQAFYTIQLERQLMDGADQLQPLVPAVRRAFGGRAGLGTDGAQTRSGHFY